jgi:hypothetical protein
LTFVQIWRASKHSPAAQRRKRDNSSAFSGVMRLNVSLFDRSP